MATEKYQKAGYIFHTERLLSVEVSEYLHNEGLIRRLIDDYRSATEAAGHLNSRLETLAKEHEQLKEQCREIKSKLELETERHNNAKNELVQARKNPFAFLLLALISNLAVAIGVNMLTNDPNDLVGISIVLFGVVLTLVAHFLHKR